jgi:hypothetical protein
MQGSRHGHHCIELLRSNGYFASDAIERCCVMQTDLPYSAEQIAAVVAHYAGGSAENYIDPDGKVIDLFVVADSIQDWLHAKDDWTACGGWEERQLGEIDYIQVKGARAGYHQRPVDFLIIDLKSGHTALWPLVP